MGQEAGAGQEVGIRAAGQFPPPVCLVVTGMGVTDGPVDVQSALPSACRTPVSGGWAVGAVSLVSVIARDSREGSCLLPCFSNPGLRHAESSLCALPKLEVRSEADGGLSCESEEMAGGSPCARGDPGGEVKGAISHGDDSQPGMPDFHIREAQTDTFYFAESIRGLANSRPE